MLVSRLTSLGRLRHQPTGYCGPLSRHFLAYQALASTVQASLRDLVEICLTTMFISGEVVRDRNDWMEISLRSVGLRTILLTHVTKLAQPTSLQHELLCSRNRCQDLFRRT